MKKIFCSLCFLITAATAVEYVPVRDADVSDPALNITKNKDGSWLEITAREWQDVVFTKEGEKTYIYQHGYNYNKKEGFLRTFTPDRKLVSEIYDKNTGGMVSREELEVAFEIFKKHTKIAQILEQEKIPVYVFGGFGYADSESEQPCYYGERCLHVFAHTSTKEMIAHAIVKLNDMSVPYPDFDNLKNKKVQ